MSFDDWQQHSMGDVVNVTQGLAINAKTKHLFRESGAPLLRISDLFSGNYAQFISEEDAPKQCIATKDEIIYTRTGQVGFVFTNKVGVVHNNCFKVTPKDKSLSPRFLYWFLYQSSIRELANTIASGSVQKDLTHSAFKTIKIKIPKLQTQEHIASILSALDNRISLLRETNTTLEAIAQTLFKSWFVDFDPVKAKAEGRLPEGMDEATAALFPSEFEESALGLIPKGWSNVSLKEVVSIFDSQRVPLSGGDRAKRKGNYPYYGAASLMDYVDGYIFDGVYCLMGEDGSVAHESGYPIMQYVWGKIWVNNHAHVLQGKNGISTEHVMLSLQRTNIQPLITGAVQAKLSQGNMWRIVFLMPSRSIAEVFGEMIAPLFTRIRHNFEKIQTLTTLRDTLLPRLISGQLRLNQAQEIMDEVGA